MCYAPYALLYTILALYKGFEHEEGCKDLNIYTSVKVGGTSKELVISRQIHMTYRYVAMLVKIVSEKFTVSSSRLPGR